MKPVMADTEEAVKKGDFNTIKTHAIHMSIKIWFLGLVFTYLILLL